MRIGVFDSGVGGLTVTSEILTTLPQAEIVYLGDTARVPYGSKSSKTVIQYAKNCTGFLLSKEVSAIVIACNTASATAVPSVQAMVGPSIPVIGAIRPGAQAAIAASTTNTIGVIATLSTIGSGAYTNAIRQHVPSAKVLGLACPLLVPLAEEGWLEDPITESIIRRYLLELFSIEPTLDTIILGCTHYPLLRQTIQRVANTIAQTQVHLVDSACTMADKLGVILADSTPSPNNPGTTPSDRPRLTCYATDATRLPELAKRFLGYEVPFTIVDLH